MDTNVVRPTGPATCTVRFDWWLDPRHVDNADTIRQVRPAYVAVFNLQDNQAALQQANQACNMFSSRGSSMIRRQLRNVVLLSAVTRECSGP